MPSSPDRRKRHTPGRELSFAEHARREQLIAVTIELIAHRGAASTSLQSIADAAGITKAAVLYHYPAKRDVILAAYVSVRDALIARMVTAIEEAPGPGEAIVAYISAQLAHLAEHPDHVRVMAESLLDTSIGEEELRDTRARWGPLADLISAAQDAGAYDPDADPRAHAIIYGGAVDALTAETLSDPAFSLSAGSLALQGVLQRFLVPGAGEP